MTADIQSCPRVFISYCWSSEDHKKWVRDFAIRLRTDGVDVILDDWDLKPGQDLYYFMEKMVNDPTITNVLIVSDKAYKNRANKRKGGVGVEAQIISPTIYHNAEQEKFIPIVCEYENGHACLPSYIANRKYIDMSAEDAFEAEYIRLLSLLYGTDALKPPLGTYLKEKDDVGAQDAGMEMVGLSATTMGISVDDVSKLDAKEILHRANSLIRDDPTAHGYSLGGMLVSVAGLHTTAISFLEKAIELDSTDANAWFNLAQNYEITGQHRKSTHAFIQTTKLDRDFAKMLWTRENTPELSQYLVTLEEQYRETLRIRTELMKRAITELMDPRSREDDEILISIRNFDIKNGTNLTQFIINLIPDGTVVAFCYPEELRKAEIIMPFHIPESQNFESRKLQFMEYFGYQQFRLNTTDADESSSDMLFLCARIPYDKLNGSYLMKWIIKSIMFQNSGESFLRDEPFWDVQVDE